MTIKPISLLLLLSLLSHLLFLYSLHSPIAKAEYTDRVCTVLNYACSKNSLLSSQASPSASDSIGNNPAFIPTDNTPFGIEILSGESETDLSVFQGYGVFGMAGGAVAKENSFYSNASNLAAADINLPAGTGDDLNKRNYGLAFSIPLFKKRLKNSFVPHIGLGLRQYRDSGQFRESYGLMLANSRFHIGVSQAKNRSNIGVLSASVGFRINWVLCDYTYIKNLLGVDNITQIISTITSYENLSLILAYRTQKIQPLTAEDQTFVQSTGKGYRKNHYFAGVQVQLGKVVTIGVYYNYILEKLPFLGLRIALGSY
ncbi:MAG: hypothetical protein HQK51_18445 [Oligoflexia bacterium]|nr:hypothetical protein [Oligoflexia bacterium]